MSFVAIVVSIFLGEQVQENELNKPWVTEAMKNEIMKKHKLYQKAKKSNDESDWKEFKEQKTRVATMIREAKLEYIGNHPEEVRFIVAVCLEITLVYFKNGDIWGPLPQSFPMKLFVHILSTIRFYITLFSKLESCL